MKFIYLLLLVALVHFNSLGQDRLALTVKMLGIKMTPPKDIPIDTIPSMLYACGKGTYHSFYDVEEKDKDILIGLNYFNLEGYAEKRLKDKFLMKRFPDYVPNREYLTLIKYTADTINNSIHYYSNEYTKEVFNADLSGEYTLGCPILYKNKYNHCKVVFLQKHFRSYILIMYFYTDKSKNIVDEYIKETSNYIRYIN